jgi:uracil-DNA glycosylase family 4
VVKRSLESIERAVVKCTRCPELRAYTAQIAREKKRAHADCVYWGKPVPAFGNERARLIIVGLAPGAHGSNRTGRPFTGDASGDFLYPALHRAGFASQPRAVDRNDGLELIDCLVTAAVRCAPPGNKPTPQELRNCFPYLVEEFDALTHMRVAVGLGSIGFSAILKVFRERGWRLDPARPKFKHAAEAAQDRRNRFVSPKPPKYEHRRIDKADVRSHLRPRQYHYKGGLIARSRAIMARRGGHTGRSTSLGPIWIAARRRRYRDARDRRRDRRSRELDGAPRCFRLERPAPKLAKHRRSHRPRGRFLGAIRLDSRTNLTVKAPGSGRLQRVANSRSRRLQEPA